MIAVAHRSDALTGKLVVITVEAMRNPADKRRRVVMYDEKGRKLSNTVKATHIEALQALCEA